MRFYIRKKQIQAVDGVFSISISNFADATNW